MKTHQWIWSGSIGSCLDCGAPRVKVGGRWWTVDASGKDVPVKAKLVCTGKQEENLTAAE